MKFSHQLVCGSLAVRALTACSSDPQERRQAKDDFDYLQTQPLGSWTVPDGAEPQFYPNYAIPQGNFQGSIGPAVDIRPPQQVLDLIPGARTEVKNGVVTIWFAEGSDAEEFWKLAMQTAGEKGILLRQSSDDRIETDWVTWESGDEDSKLEARYLLERIAANNRSGLTMTLIDWRESGKNLLVSDSNRERYNIFMINQVMSSYDLKQREAALLKAQQLVKNIPVSMGTDRGGLPVIIARAQYDVFWERAVDLLPKLGFTLEERNRSQGYIKAKFSELGEDYWAALGAEPLVLRPISYSLSLGDLGNRTSVSLSEPDGKPVPDEVLESLVPALEAVIEAQ